MLKRMYEQLEKRIKSIAFDSLWEGFERFDFALYNDVEAIMDGEVFPRPEVFLANTSIWYEGRYIAIWKLTEEMDVDVLASKIIHEMFHAYQNKQQESRYANELEAIWKYEYSVEYLQIKHDENKLLVALNQAFNEKKLRDFLSYRKMRQEQYPYQYYYESKVEVIEGSANFVELQALKTLNRELYDKHLTVLLEGTCRIDKLIPIRIISYDVGALFLKVCIENNVPLNLTVGKYSEGFFDTLVNKMPYEVGAIKPTKEITDFYNADRLALERKIGRIINKSKEIIKGDFELLGFNVYSARYKNGYIYTQYFLMYKDQEPVTLQGNYVFKLGNNKVTEIYKEA